MIANSRTLALPFLLLMTVAARAAEIPPETGESKRWELKGVQLGSSLDQVKAQVPNATCTTKPTDTGVVLCIDEHNTLGGEAAEVAVKLLDGEVVQIAIENLTYEQAFAACAPLAAKFGPATEISKIMTQLQRGRYVEKQNKERCVWRDGEKAFYVEPADWTNKKKQFTYSAVILTDHAKHNREWVVRYNASGAPKDL